MKSYHTTENISVVVVAANVPLEIDPTRKIWVDFSQCISGSVLLTNSHAMTDLETKLI